MLEFTTIFKLLDISNFSISSVVIKFKITLKYSPDHSPKTSIAINIRFESSDSVF